MTMPMMNANRLRCIATPDYGLERPTPCIRRLEAPFPHYKPSPRSGASQIRPALQESAGAPRQPGGSMSNRPDHPQVLASASESRIESIAQAITQEVEGEHGNRQRNCRKKGLIGIAANNL